MRVSRLGGKTALAVTGILLALVLCVPSLANAASYKATILTADTSGIAPNTDPNLVNPWGVSFAPGGPFWVSDNNTGLSTLYNGTGQVQPLVVVIPPPTGSSAISTPTGTVYNATGGFVVKKGSLTGAGIFLFDTEDGTISGWNPSVDATNAILAVDNSSSGAVYKAMELANNGTGNFLYVPNFFSAKIEVYDTNFNLVNLAGSFTDPQLPPGFAPHNIRNIGGKLYVAYAKQNAQKTDAKIGAGLGLVDVFDLNGNFIKHFAFRGKLNAPWGLAQAPANFGTFSNAILIGNLGDGRITAYNATTGALLGQFSDAQNRPLAFAGLWALTFGNGGQGGSTNVLYFTSGPSGYNHGRLGSIAAQ